MALIRIQEIKLGHHWVCLSWKLSEVMSIYIIIYRMAGNFGGEFILADWRF